MCRLKKILVVDDNPVNLEIVREMLDGEYSIASARDGMEAVLWARQFQPPIVLLDVMMPGINGYETCRVLRRLPGMRDARIVIVSAKAMPAERAQGFAAGADAYLTKPFDEVQLAAAINSPSKVGCNSNG